MFLQAFVRRYFHQPKPKINVKPGLGDAFDEESASFHILNRVCIAMVKCGLFGIDECSEEC